MSTSLGPYRRKWGKSKKKRSSSLTPEAIREEVGEAREIVLGFERLDKSNMLYPSGSTVLRQQLEDLYDRVQRFLARLHALELTIGADEIEYESEVVYDATKSNDRQNLAFTLEDGGIRRLVFLSGIDRGELQGFVDACKKSRENDADDLSTLLWTHGLRHVSYMTVHFYAENVEQSVEDLLSQSTRLTLVDRLRNRELAIDQIAMVRSDRAPDQGDQDLPEIFGLSAQDIAEIQRRIVEYQSDLGLGPFCRVILSLLILDQSEEACRLHLSTLQEALASLVDEGQVAVAAEVVGGVRKLADASGGYGQSRAVSVALRGFIAVAAKKELGTRMAEHLNRGHVDLRPILAYIRALGKHAVYLASEFLGGKYDTKIVGAIAEGCAGDYAHIRDFVTDDNSRMAAAAVKILAEVAGDGARVDFIRASSHKDPGVRREAFVGLARCKDPRALDRLHAAFDDPDPEIRLSSLRAFGNWLLKPRPELYARVEALVVDRRFPERPAAEQESLFAILGKLDPSKGVPFLRQKLTRFALFRRAAAHRLRLVAAAALAEVATDEAEAALKAAAETKNEEIHRACRLALDRLELVRASAKHHLDRERAGFEPDRSGIVRAFDRSAAAALVPRVPLKTAAARAGALKKQGDAGGAAGRPV